MTPHKLWQPPPISLHRAAVVTPRQADVLTGVVLGLSNADIGARLYLSEDTVKTHVKALLRATGCRNRQQLAVAAVTPGCMTVVVSPYTGRAMAGAA